MSAEQDSQNRELSKWRKIGLTLSGRDQDKQHEDGGQFVYILLRLQSKFDQIEPGMQRMITWQLTSSSNFCTLIEMYSMRLPSITCIGMIQDFRRPMDGTNKESTTGDHNSLREYG
jgi:hypothetical protein